MRKLESPCTQVGLRFARVDRTVYGDQHPNVAIRLNNLGSVYFALGEKQKAKEYFQPAHAIPMHFFAPVHPNTKTVAKWLAACDV